jgi:hypothetical protein
MAITMSGGAYSAVHRPIMGSGPTTGFYKIFRDVSEAQLTLPKKQVNYFSVGPLLRAVKDLK